MQVVKPETWELFNFKSITKNVKIKKNKILASDYLQEGKYPIIDQGKKTIGGFTNDSSLIYKCELPVVIFGDHTLIVKFIDYPFAIGADGTKIIHVNQEKCVPKFLYYAIVDKELQSEGYKRHFSKLRKQTFAIPPLSEQQKIISILSNVDNLLQDIIEIIDQIHRVKNGLIPKLLTEGIRHTKFKKTKLNFGNEIETPDNWNIRSLKQIATLFVPMRDKPKKFGGNIPWLRIDDFDGKYASKSKSNQNVTEKTVKEMKLRVYPTGTVLCACSATAIGNYAITTQPLVTNQTFIGIYPNEELTAEFLYYYLLTQTENLIILGSGRTAQAYISRKKFESFRIPVPPLVEQQKITSILLNIDTQIEKYQLYKSNLEKLKKWLVRGLFTGKIRVKF